MLCRRHYLDIIFVIFFLCSLHRPWLLMQFWKFETFLAIGIYFVNFLCPSMTRLDKIAEWGMLTKQDYATVQVSTVMEVPSILLPRRTFSVPERLIQIRRDKPRHLKVCPSGRLYHSTPLKSKIIDCWAFFHNYDQDYSLLSCLFRFVCVCVCKTFSLYMPNSRLHRGRTD